MEPALLAPLVPAGTTLDRHDGITYLSVVAFQFLETRVFGIGVPGHRNFEELNLRFYVRREVGGEVRRGVVFVREVVPRRAIALVARAVYHEPYIALPMRHEVSGHPPRARYGWSLRRTWHELAAQAEGEGVIPGNGSVASYLTEHYWGYTRQPDGGTLEYKVIHTPWTVWRARLLNRPDFAPLYGSRFAGAMREPESVLLAAGSPVTVCRGERL